MKRLLTMPHAGCGLTWLVLAIALAIRLGISGQFLLVPDEANYWQWSRHLALCYHDHPPMIAWTIWLSTALFGHQAWAVRLPTILALTCASAYLALLAARWFSWRVALQVTLLGQLVLLFNGSALIATPDGLLLGCWAAACLHAALALERGRPGQWLATGLWFGLGLLSKYTMVLFLPSLFLAAISVKDYRSRLLSPWPWLGLLLGSLVFLPVVLWNSTHDWVTFRHVLYQGGKGSAAWFTLRYLGDYFGSQLMLCTPVTFLLMLAAWFRPALRRALPQGPGAFLLWTSLPGFLLFLALSFHVRIYGNWPAPAYLTASLLIAALFSTRPNGQPGLPTLWRAALATAALVSLPVLVQVTSPLLPIPLDLDRTARECVGWDDLGRQTGAALATMPRPGQTFLFGLRYQYASELAFYVPGQPQTVSINRWTRPNVYDFWVKEEDVLGQDGLGILEHPQSAQELAALFTHADPIEEIRLYRDSPWFGRQVVQTLYLFRGYGFKGGLRWQPQDQADVRATRRAPNSTR